MRWSTRDRAQRRVAGRRAPPGSPSFDRTVMRKKMNERLVGRTRPCLCGFEAHQFRGCACSDIPAADGLRSISTVRPRCG